MRTINISEFRANLLKYLAKARSGEQISITSNGVLLATISPPTDAKESAKNLLRTVAATAEVHDVTTPLDEDWDASL